MATQVRTIRMIRAEPIQIAGSGWDVEVTTWEGDMYLLCEGRAPYTHAQAQAAADTARRDEWNNFRRSVK